MALFGPWSAILEQTKADARFRAAGGYLQEMLAVDSAGRARIGRIAEGTTERIDLADGSFALEQVYRAKERSEGFFESHRQYIDVQVIVAGEELMEVEDVSRLVVAQPYDPARDFLKYADTATAAVLRMRAGDVAVFFPCDGHMPSLRWREPGLVRKTVIKVPVVG